jgi:hypothetical protein
MPSPRHILTAAALGALAGALGALWVTVADAQGLTMPTPRRQAVAPRACVQRVTTADNSTPRPTEASKPVVDDRVIGCP